MVSICKHTRTQSHKIIYKIVVNRQSFQVTLELDIYIYKTDMANPRRNLA